MNTKAFTGSSRRFWWRLEGIQSTFLFSEGFGCLII
jgi:hypothetical protein